MILKDFHTFFYILNHSISSSGYKIYQEIIFQFVLRRHITLWQFVGAALIVISIAIAKTPDLKRWGNEIIEYDFTRQRYIILNYFISKSGYEIYHKIMFQFVLRRHITLWQFVGAVLIVISIAIAKTPDIKLKRWK